MLGTSLRFMVTTVTALVTLDRVNQLIKDQVVNTWHFKCEEVDLLAECLSITTALQDFYETIDGAMSPVLNGDGLIRFYDLQDAVPRAPIHTGTLALVVDASTPLPSECAVCLSYRATQFSGLPPARRKGRIFLGPWSVDALTVGTNDGLVAQATYEAIAGAATTLQAAGAGNNWAWVVFSPTTAGAPPWSSGELIAASQNVVEGHVDNAFDTMRSRGALATHREQW